MNKDARIKELEAACRCAARALRMHQFDSPTAVMLDEYGEGKTPEVRCIVTDELAAAADIKV